MAAPHGRRLWAFARPFAWGALTGLVFTDTVASLVRVEGVSMQPLLNPHLPAAAATAATRGQDARAAAGASPATAAAASSSSSSPSSSSSDVVLVDKLSVHTLRRSVERGDVVVLTAPDDPGALIVKRVVGLPGDEVRLPRLPLQSPPATTTTTTAVVPAGHFWVEGDNPSNSTDSASRFGALPLGLLQGRVVSVVWPPSRFRAWLGREAEEEDGTRLVRRRAAAADEART